MSDIETPMPFQMDDYDPGRKLNISFTPIAGTKTNGELVGGDARDIQLEIVKAFKPFTMAVVCEVKLAGQNAAEDHHWLESQRLVPGHGQETFVMKLYDRRYNRNTREDDDKGRPYDEDREASYLRHLGNQRLNVAHLNGCSCSDCDIGKFEAWLENGCRGQFALESEVYSRITTGLLQGDTPAAPYFFGTLQNTCSPIGPINGLLIEHVSPSISFERFLKTLGPCGKNVEVIRSVVERVVRGFNSLLKYDFLNHDNRLDDILLQYSTDMGPNFETWTIADAENLRVAFIDFGAGRLRKPNETDREWQYRRFWDNFTSAIQEVTQNLMELAYQQVCKTHNGTCWPKPMPNERPRTFDWTVDIDDCHKWHPTEEEEKLISIWLLEFGKEWGTCDMLYPRTMAELDSVCESLGLSNPLKSPAADSEPTDAVRETMSASRIG